MHIAGIIAEYNPFHNGHLLLTQAARRAGAEAVVAVMGGNWLQRGGPALFPKEVRARAALLSGVDLVVELPLPYAAATAERFARGGVALLLGLGCVELLAFGSEHGEIAPLERCAAALADPRLDGEIKGFLSRGLPYAAARQRGVAALFGEETAAPLSRPNDILGVQYLRELARLGGGLRPFTIPRQGAGHHDAGPCPGGEERIPTASASWLRGRLLAGGWEDAAPCLPEGSRRVIREAWEQGRWADPARLELPLLAALRRMGREDLARLPDVSEGLENRLATAVKESAGLEQLLDRAVTKRYPRARLRRVLLSAFLGVPPEMSAAPPPYLRVLGMGPRGAEVLARAKRTATLPLSHSLARLERTGDRAAAFAALESRSTDLYNLLYPVPRPCGTDYETPLIRIK